MKTIAFFNNKGGVGKTSLVYHLGWMLANQGVRVIAADLDPQANLTSMFVDSDRLEELWQDDHSKTVYGAVQPLLEGTGDITTSYIEDISDNIGLLVGDLSLSASEDEMSSQWPRCMDGDRRAFRVISAFFRVMQQAAETREADVVLIDVGPNLGALNRGALIAAESIVIPLAPDIFSLQGLQNLGPTLRRWREEWRKRRNMNPVEDLHLPRGAMEPLGYVVMQHAIRLDRPVKAYKRWMGRIPGVYQRAVLDREELADITVEKDPHCLASLKHYRSLMPLAQEARKPMFHLKPADGAIGAHVVAVQNCYQDFYELARRIAEKSHLAVELAG